MIRVWRYWVVRQKALLLVSQFALLTALFTLTLWDRAVHSLPLAFRSNLGLIGLILILLSPQICSYFIGLHTLIVSPNFRLFVTRALSSLVLGLVLTAPLFAIFPRLYPGFANALAAVCCSSLLLFALRPLLYWMIKHKRFVEGLMILGTGEVARKFHDDLMNGNSLEANGCTDAAVFLPYDPSGVAEPFEDSGEMIGYKELPEITLRDRISRIVVAEPNAKSSEGLAVALLDCKLQGLQVEEAVESYEKLNSKIRLEGLRPEWLVYTDGFKPSKYYLHFKRIFDSVCAFVLVALTAVPCILISILIRLTSRGPVLFRQVRVGFHGKQFTLLKFRTMYADAERRTGPVWATDSDQRITGLGKYLRKFRLDEIPQLFNVLRGDMSLIGPRPERPYFVELLNKHIHYYGLRHCVKPGITGWAQVLYPYGASVQDAYEKLQYDLYYAKHMSLGFDLRILFGTTKVVLFGRGR
jgi:sugar transferase (PEP-CTERM system associated)